jgi:predicted nucleotidyltransferase
LINTPISEDQLSFEICFARALDIEVEGVHIKTVSLNDLIILKRHSARPRDLEDIRRLGMK